MATIKYRADASSPWQKVWVRITNFASEIFTSRGKSVEQELDEIVAKIAPVPSQLDSIEAQTMFTSLMTDTLLEEDCDV